MSESRNWCFTDFNVTDERKAFYMTELSCKYIVIGSEICPKTKTPHLQGFVIFKGSKSFKKAKHILPDKVNIRQAKGTPLQASVYCIKDGDYQEKGPRPKTQGSRSDIDRTKEIVQETSSIRAVLDDVFNFQCVRTAEIYLKYKEKPRPIQPIKVIWLYGPSGVGKSKYVWDRHNIDDVYQPISYKWWEGYDAHSVVLIDDIRGDFCKFHELLKLLDIYPFRVESKGGSRQVQFHTLYITCPYEPSNLYHNVSEDMVQLERRITQIIHLV